MCVCLGGIEEVKERQRQEGGKSVEQVAEVAEFSEQWGMGD